MSRKIVVEEKPGLYVSEVFSNLRNRHKKPKLVEGQPPLPFNPAPLLEFLRVMGGSDASVKRYQNKKNDASDVEETQTAVKAVTPESEDSAHFTVNLGKELGTQVFALAQKKGLTVNELIRNWVEKD
jgi:predicted HicB family RNase H-like nuclease